MDTFNIKISLTLNHKSIMTQQNSKSLHLLIGFTVLFIPFILGQPEICDKIASGCEECLQTRGCEWCSHPNLTKEAKRCRTKGSHSSEPLCTPEFLESPVYSQNINPDSVGEDFHLSPQEISIRPIVNEPVQINLKYKEEKDKKLDLYYLLDVSKTMEENKRIVIKESTKLQNDLQKITKDLFMGFGTFIDKPVVPFSDSAQLKKPENERPYAFKNNLGLTNVTNNLQQFNNSLNLQNTRENQDIPEGTLDGLMQAIVCEKEIGWRSGSQKLIVVATDDLFHVAGDGKLGGVIIPNDMECHLNKDQIYDKATEFDYPSVGQIKHVIGKYGINVIFAIVPKKSPNDGSNDYIYKQYEEIGREISSVRVARLQSDSKDVIDKITKLYKNISSKVELYQPPETINLDTYMDISYKVQCKPDEQFNSGSSCDNVNPEDEIKFQINLTLKKCPNINQATLEFSTFGLKARERLLVHVDFGNCKCQCTKNYDEIAGKKYIDEANIHCTDKSLGMKCGLCDCQAGYLGSRCECNQDRSISNSVYDNKTCIYKNDKQLCSGRGGCICGSCSCTDGAYVGNYCEIDNSPCIVKEGTSVKECSNNGNCVDGPNGRHCQCNDGYLGEKCECRTDKKKEYCKSPSDPSGLECSGNGKCECMNGPYGYGWECQCNGGKEAGRFCEKTDQGTSAFLNQCEDKRLHKCLKSFLKTSEENDRIKKDPGFIDCTLLQSDTGQTNETSCTNLKSPKEECYSKEEGYGISFYDVSVVGSISHKWTCKLKYNESCETTFSFEYQGGPKRDELIVQVLEISKSLCPEPVGFLTYIFAVVGSILAIGILTLLLWKLLTMWHDRAEFQKFEKERAAARWDTGENPLYNTPMSQFENPAYRN